MNKTMGFRGMNYTAKPRNAVWWLNPAFLIAINLIITVVALLQSERSYVVEYGSEKWIDLPYVAVSFAFLLFMALGIWFGRNGYKAKNTKKCRSVRVLNRSRMLSAFFVVTIVCVFSYIIWYINFIRIYGFSAFLSAFNPSVLAANINQFHAETGSISGVTTFTEFGIISAALGAIIMCYDETDSFQKRRIKIWLSLIFLLACFRAILFSERLAIVELIVPFVIAWFGISKKPLSVMERWIPLAAVALLILLFGLFEYSRSWLSYYANYYNSFWEFIVARVFGYYTNAANVESMYIRNGVTSWLPYYSIQWLWQMPGMQQVYSTIADPDIGNLYSFLLHTLANPEFNNPGGVLTFFKDFSWLGLLPEFIFGYLLGRFYEGFRAKSPLHLMLYSVFYLTMIELPRYFYLGVNRGFVVVVGFCVVLMVCGTNTAEVQERSLRKARSRG
mgnify:CR=1 FL=1